MKTIGEAVTNSISGSAVSRQDSGLSGQHLQAKAEIDAGRIPAEYDHFSDVAIPGRLWSAFIPADGSARAIVRAPTEAEHRVLDRRKAALEVALLPYRRPQQDDDVALAITEMFASYRTARERGAGAVGTVANVMDALAPYPLWAIQQACMSIRTRGYEIDEGGRKRLEQTWAPSDPIIIAQVEKVVLKRRVALVQATALLAAPVESEVVARAPHSPSVSEMLREFHSTMQEGETEEERAARREAAERRKADLLAATERLRLKEFADKGLTPPAGSTLSLGMLLRFGWKIEQEPDGKMVLTAPSTVRP